MLIPELKIYEYIDILGEPKYARIRATGEDVEIKDLTIGALIDCLEGREVIESTIGELGTIRRAEDGIGIELVSRGSAGTSRKGIVVHTIYPLDFWEGILTNYQGYPKLNDMLKRYGM